MAPGLATSLTATLIAVFGGSALWKQRGVGGPDIDNIPSNGSLSLLSLEPQQGIDDGGSQITVDETYVAQGPLEEPGGVELESFVDVAETNAVKGSLEEQRGIELESVVNTAVVLGELDPTEPDFVEQPAFATASAPAFEGLGASETPERMTSSLHEAPPPAASAHQLPDSPLYALVIALSCILAGLLFFEEFEECLEKFVEVPAALLHWLPKCGVLAADLLDDGVVESPADLSQLFSGVARVVEDDVATRSFLPDFRSLPPAVWAEIHEPFHACSGGLWVEGGVASAQVAGDGCPLKPSDLLATDFRSLPSAVWAEIHKPLRACLGDVRVEGAVASAQVGGHGCPLTPSVSSAVPFATADVAIEFPSQLQVVQNNSFEQESVSSDDIEVLEGLSLVLNEDAGTAHAAHAEQPAGAECQGESDQQVMPPCTPRAGFPAPRMEKVKMEEDEKAGLEWTLRGISSPNRRRPASSTERTQPSEL